LYERLVASFEVEAAGIEVVPFSGTEWRLG